MTVQVHAKFLELFLKKKANALGYLKTRPKD
jgi:hypothetical protein